MESFFSEVLYNTAILIAMTIYWLIAVNISSWLRYRQHHLLRALSIVAMSLIAPFHESYKLILFGSLFVYAYGTVWHDPMEMSPFELRYSRPCYILGNLCMVIGVVWGIYYFFTH